MSIFSPVFDFPFPSFTVSTFLRPIIPHEFYCKANPLFCNISGQEVVAIYFYHIYISDYGFSGSIQKSSKSNIKNIYEFYILIFLDVITLTLLQKFSPSKLEISKNLSDEVLVTGENYDNLQEHKTKMVLRPLIAYSEERIKEELEKFNSI